MTLLFMILFFGVLGKLFSFAFRMTWGMMKFMLMMIIVPVIVFSIIGGLVRMILPVLLVIGIVCLLKRETA
jgi:hypothetical protein